eukprot:NODE_613_length_1305_cov_156.536624_g480_i0.p1 GENE.NODE_613_length_1305_cov_156.536624_g480_i0~~NODE_613_length_1305_cov_156.536624_g480_i0.p1  ORF type:complete len:262 (-),score=22.90 NODE_613_length_1305_cov_156.536624_g480_i0:134-919(-)
MYCKLHKCTVPGCGIGKSSKQTVCNWHQSNPPDAILNVPNVPMRTSFTPMPASLPTQRAPTVPTPTPSSPPVPPVSTGYCGPIYIQTDPIPVAVPAQCPTPTTTPLGPAPTPGSGKCMYYSNQARTFCEGPVVCDFLFCRDHKCGFQGCGVGKPKDDPFCYWHSEVNRQAFQHLDAVAEAEKQFYREQAKLAEQAKAAEAARQAQKASHTTNSPKVKLENVSFSAETSAAATSPTSWAAHAHAPAAFRKGYAQPPMRAPGK